MSGTQIGGVWIELYDRQGNISRNANRGVGVNTVDISLNDADLKVARAMAIDPKSVAMLKYKHGKGGLAGVALFADSGLPSSPFPSAEKFKAPVEPDDDDDEVDTDENLREAKRQVAKKIRLAEREAGMRVHYPKH